MLGIDRLGYWAPPVGLRRARPASTCPARPRASCRPTTGSSEVFGQHIYPGEIVPGGHRPGLRHGHAAPAHQRLRRARQRRHAVPAADRAQVLGPDGKVVKPFKPEVIRKLPIDPQRAAGRCGSRPATCWSSATPTTSWTCPIVIAGKSGTAEFGVRDSQGRLPFHSWFVGFTPKDARKKASDPDGFEAVSRTDSQLVVPGLRLRLPDASATPATEIVKYFLQLHYGLKKDLRLTAILLSPRQLLRRLSRWARCGSNRPGSRTWATPSGQRRLGASSTSSWPSTPLALVVIGLLMAFTNSGDAPGGRLARSPAASMWLAIARWSSRRRGARLPLVARRSRGRSTSSTSACWC